MTKYIYRLNKIISKTEEGKEYVAYGIDAWVIQNGKSQLAQYIPDLFLEYDRAERFVNTCNSLEIDWDNIMDVIEDELS